jgi:hypothetical protein
MAMQNIVPGLSNAIDTVAKVPLGTIVEDENGNEWIYLSGVASTVAGSCVSFNVATFATALSVVGLLSARIAFAGAATVASTFGWYCVKGTCACVTNAATVANAPVFITAAPGAVDDAVVATDRIENAWFVTATTPAGTVHIVYPTAIGLG